MEPAEAWGHWGFQSGKNWTVEEPHPQQAAGFWAPGTGFPVEYYASVDIFDTNTCSLQAYMDESSRGKQLVEHYYYSSATQHDAQNHRQQHVVMGNSGEHQVADVDDPQDAGETTKIVVSNGSRATDVCTEVSSEFKDDMDLIKDKMHRYPASLLGVDKRYTEPRVVALGPYHHHLQRLKQAEKVKHAAAIVCVEGSGPLLEEMYEKVASVADDVRCLYDKKVMAGFGYDEFRHMMFFDACFLVQFMLMWDGGTIDESLHGFFGPNSRDIRHDILLLENQLPWKVLETVLGFMDLSLDQPGYASIMKHYLQDQKHPRKDESTLDDGYKPPHLLGMFWHYAIGRRSSDDLSNNQDAVKREPEVLLISISPKELAEIGIKLTADKTTEISRMGLRPEGTLFTKLSLAPLSLDHNRASYLVSLAALEMCTVKDFLTAPVEDSAVCSYLQLLTMLVSSAEDVQEVRARGLLQGGGGLTNEQVLTFFSSLQGLPRGSRFLDVMEDIQRYKEHRWLKTNICTFLYNNMKLIAAVATGVGTVGGIIGTLISIRESI